jgi:hypothetical protein
MRTEHNDETNNKNIKIPYRELAEAAGRSLRDSTSALLGSTAPAGEPIVGLGDYMLLKSASCLVSSYNSTAAYSSNMYVRVR